MVTRTLTLLLGIWVTACGRPHEDELTSSGRPTQRSQRPSEVARLVGAPAPVLDVEHWFHGRAAYEDTDATLLVFCEIWGPACKAELPKLVSERSEYEAAGIQIVGLTRVTKSATDENVRKFLEQHGIRFPFAKEREASVSRALGLRRTGVAVLVRGSKVVWAGLLTERSEALVAR